MELWRDLLLVPLQQFPEARLQERLEASTGGLQAQVDSLMDTFVHGSFNEKRHFKKLCTFLYAVQESTHAEDPFTEEAVYEYLRTLQYR